MKIANDFLCLISKRSSSFFFFLQEWQCVCIKYISSFNMSLINDVIFSSLGPVVQN